MHPAVIAKELGDFLYRGKLPREQTTIASGGYGIARFVRRELRGYRPGQIMNGAYQYGAIGPDLGYAVGALSAGLIADAFGLQAAIASIAVLTFLSGTVVLLAMTERRAW